MSEQVAAVPQVRYYEVEYTVRGHRSTVSAPGTTPDEALAFAVKHRHWGRNHRLVHPPARVRDDVT